jgi:hypothetical protein
MSKPATDPAANLARFENRRYGAHAEMTWLVMAGLVPAIHVLLPRR